MPVAVRATSRTRTPGRAQHVLSLAIAIAVGGRACVADVGVETEQAQAAIATDGHGRGAERMNVFFIAIDDLRAQFGRSFRTPEVLTPHLDKFFLDGGGSTMQHSYVQIAVCGPSRSTMLTGRRPDTTQVGTGGKGWCWCQRTNCTSDSLFMTLPTYMRQHGYVTAGNGKLFHPDACHQYKNFSHAQGDDPRAWSYGQYGVEANVTQEQWGTIPGPHDAVFNKTMGLSFMESSLTDEEQTDGKLASGTIERLANFSRDGIGKAGRNTPFFLSTGLHKPHLPHIVPKKYFDLYPADKVSLAPNRFVPTGFKEENFHADGTFELISYNLNAGPAFAKDNFSFSRPLGDDFSRAQRRGYFAAVSFMDAQVGRMLSALEEHDYTSNTVVVLWGDHGWHLGDTNSWGKMTNFESGVRNALMWRVPGQREASKGLNTRFVETIDIFPTIVELTRLPALPKCEGVDQPPSVLCLQGESFASEFMDATAQALTSHARPSTAPPKQYVFSQWPFAPWGPQKALRQGYTVRSASGYRYTTYVPYSTATFKGEWSATGGDEELYDYNADPWETTNFAANASYSATLATLKAVLRAQYA